jgi:hypothetical protein
MSDRINDHEQIVADEPVEPWTPPTLRNIREGLLLVANRQRIVQSGRCFFRHRISVVNVCGNGQQPRG